MNKRTARKIALSVVIGYIESGDSGGSELPMITCEEHGENYEIDGHKISAAIRKITESLYSQLERLSEIEDES